MDYTFYPTFFQSSVEWNLSNSLNIFYQKTEPWEAEARSEEVESEEDEEEEKPMKKRKNPKRIRLIDGALYRMNQYGKYFKMQIKTKH